MENKMALKDSIIPAQRFSFSDNQNVIPTASFFDQDLNEVLNGQIPGSNTAISSLSNLSGILNNQTPSTNLIQTGLNDVSMIGNSISGAISDVTGVIGSVVNDVGQLVDTVANTICGVASTVLDDALSLVNSVIGGVTGAIGGIFGDITKSVPALNSLSSNCLSGLFKGPLGITGNAAGLCGNLNGNCGGGVLSTLVQSLTCNSASNGSFNQNNPLMSSLQSNFLTNASQQATSSLGINNVMSSLSTCPSNPFNLQALNGFALNTLQQYPSSTSMLDFGNVGGALGTNLPNIGSMVPNAISEFTNNFSYPDNPVYNSGSSTPIAINASSIQNSFNAISPGWNTSSYDGIPSISSMLDDGSNGNLSNTDTYNAYQLNNSSTLTAGGGSTAPNSYTGLTDSSNWGSLNNQIANNGYSQTYLSMASGTNNGTNYIKQISTVNNILGGGLSSPSMNNYNAPSTSSTTIFGIGSSNGSPTINENIAPALINANQTVSSLLGNGNSRQQTMSQALSQGVNASASYYNTTPIAPSGSQTVSGASPAVLTSEVLGNGSSQNNSTTSTPAIQITNNNSSYNAINPNASVQLVNNLLNVSNSTKSSNLSNAVNRDISAVVPIDNFNNIIASNNINRSPRNKAPTQMAYIPSGLF
jgi:hypothetical protein